MFEHLAAAPIDPILGLTDLYHNDIRINKINLGIGVYKDENGQTPVLSAVKKAEQCLVENETTKNYLNIEGSALFAHCTQTLLFGTNSNVISNQLVRTVQTVGGTGALRVAADFASTQLNVKRAWISGPTWPNHHNIFNAAGIELLEYAYYNADEHTLDFDAMLTSLDHVQAGEVVIFHGCCHNPTGIDPTPEQWKVLASLCVERGWLPLFDFAYQGLANSLDADAQGLRIFVEVNSELLIASSYSKNFGLYNERVGAFTLVAKSEVAADCAYSQVKSIIRANYSSPPSHGGQIVAMIMSTPSLHSLWEQELTDMRQRIQRMRQLFVKTLQAKGAKQNYQFILRQNGMFSFSGLTHIQVQRLRDEFAIYVVNSGRINVAGMTLNNITALCEAIIAIESNG